MKVSIILPYIDANRYTGLWAMEENRIDFRQQPELAARCTTAFAAIELKKYLLCLLDNVEIDFRSEPDQANLSIVLGIQKGELADDYVIEPVEGGVKIAGGSRRSLLYGIYEFLKLQGFRWYYPGEAGEYIPSKQNTLVIPGKKCCFSPEMQYGRGFDMLESFTYTSHDFMMWMIRNRMSVAVCREPTKALAGKLDLISKFGGHIFERMLDPNKPWSDGNTLFNAHQQWYGLPASGVRKKETAMKTQLCVANSDMFDYLGEEFIGLLMNEWYHHDRIDIWGFDTWGGECCCERCRVIGNNTDRAIYFLSRLRAAINKAYSGGILNHQVQLVACAYEGTATISAPTGETPENLVEAGDSIVFYPINRCYEHTMEDESCTINTFYHRTIMDWMNSKNKLPITIGEYYNVSKFEDLPLLFTETMQKDIPYFRERGFTGITYMHVPLLRWGIRSLIHMLFAELSWDININAEELINEYFCKLYGNYSEQMKQIYTDVEKAWKLSASWRAWDQNSLLSQLLGWDGKKPEKPLFSNGHFHEGIVKSGKESIQLMEKACRAIKEIMRAERERLPAAKPALQSNMVNPNQLNEINWNKELLSRLGEILRQNTYGLDVIAAMTAVCGYYDALHGSNQSEADSFWEQIEEYEQKLESYYMPITQYRRDELAVDDALTRSQLSDIISRCRYHRLVKRSDQHN